MKINNIADRFFGRWRSVKNGGADWRKISAAVFLLDVLILI